MNVMNLKPRQRCITSDLIDHHEYVILLISVLLCDISHIDAKSFSREILKIGCASSRTNIDCAVLLLV